MQNLELGSINFERKIKGLAPFTEQYWTLYLGFFTVYLASKRLKYLMRYL